MILCLAFVGKLPSYIVESIHQIRCFSSDDIYLIINDVSSPYLAEIIKYNVIIVNYTTVVCGDFIHTVNANINKFHICSNLHGREELFIRSFERFFLLYNLLKSRDLSNCLFLELDNLIYDDPNKWLEQFSQSDLCYMYDNDRRFSSGLMYVKNADALSGFLTCILRFISNSTEFMTEMTALSIYYDEAKGTGKVQILPTYWPSSDVNAITYQNFNGYHAIFDALAIGCNLLGLDPYHTNGVIVPNSKSGWSAIDYTRLKFEWKTDDRGRRRPYVWNGGEWLLVNNLHVHSKDLKNGLSLPLER